ncbi:MAG: sulfatase [Verrucomicrobiota bacterium]
MRILLSLTLVLCTLSLRAEDPPNILFLAIDDMNDWVGFLDGHPEAQTPNMDALAKKGVNFTNAHCVSPACSPSRNALLFGVEPFHSGLYPFYTQEGIPEEVLNRYATLPQFFKENGYETFGAGKIHHGPDIENRNHLEWTEFHKPPHHKLIYQPEKGYQQGDSTKMAFCPTSNPLEEHPDHKVASFGVDVLGREHEKPFFLAVGIVKPHLAFVCPEQFFDLYPAEIEPPLIKADDHSDIPWAGRAMAKIGDDQRYRKDEAWNAVRRSYLACITWADYNVGRVLDALEKSPYADNTIVVLWSDHGYGMGEKRHFRKFSLWEESTRVPFLLWDTRDKEAPEGRECDDGASLIHVYRTLADLAGLTPPDYVDGVSLAPQLENPDAEISYPCITTWGRGNYTLRTRDWRYTRYFDGSEELYDHRSDPNEWTNLAGQEAHAEKQAELAAQLPDRETEAPLIREGISLWNLVDADKPSLEAAQKKWKQVNRNIDPPLGE